jgi:hypothetical protein
MNMQKKQTLSPNIPHVKKHKQKSMKTNHQNGREKSWRHSKHLSDIIQTWFRHHLDNIPKSSRYHSNIIQTSFRQYLDNTKTTTASQ